MPYFKWSGIDLSGKNHSGVLRAQSEKDLKRKLLAEDIALLNCVSFVKASIFKPVKFSHILHFFKKLSLLLDSGMYLDEALKTIVIHTHNPYFKEIVEDILFDIQSGIYLHDSLEKHPHIFTPLIIQIVHSGQESGKMNIALKRAHVYLSNQYMFKQKIRGAAFLPIITLSFFLVIALVIFIYIVPAFAHIFYSAGQTIPWQTELILKISDFLTSYWVLIFLVIFLFSVIGVRLIQKHKRSKKIVDYLLFYIPGVGNVLGSIHTTSFLQALSLLLHGGVDIVTALSIIRKSTHHSIMKNVVSDIENNIKSGSVLYDSFADIPKVFQPEILSVIRIAQDSGKRMPDIFQKAADISHNTVMNQLEVISKIVQPLLMIFLGVLITMLICAVYMPIFDLSYVIA